TAECPHFSPNFVSHFRGALQSWPCHALVNRRLRFGCRFHPRIGPLALAPSAGILPAHMMNTLEAARKIFHLPALVGADLLALHAAAGTGTLLCAQFVDARGEGYMFEVGKRPPPSAPLHPPQFLFRSAMRRNIVRLNRLTVQLLGEVQQQLGQIARALETIHARTV